MTRPASITGIVFALALAGCGRSEAPVPEPAQADELAAVGLPPEPFPAATDSAGPLPTAPASQPGGSALPAALQGRWGLVPADCTSTRGDAKGLLVIGPDTLRFYESTARTGTVSEESTTRIRASFAFSGEGSVWTREMLLEVSDGGKTLTRRDYGGDAGTDPLIYTRC